MDSRYKMPSEKRKIGGKIYTYLEWRKGKRDAEGVADRWRAKGYNVRVMPFNRGYSVYIRK